MTRIDEIKARLAAATPGPWWVGDGKRPHYAEDSSILCESDALSWRILLEFNYNFPYSADAAFIAAARTAVPALLDEVARLRARIAQLEAMLDNRAGKLLRKGKYFIVVANDEPYFADVYAQIRKHEIEAHDWNDDDEKIYLKEIKAAELERRDDSDKTYFTKLNGADYITDGFGTFWPAKCMFCGAPMQVVRPGFARCSAECYAKDAPA